MKRSVALLVCCWFFVFGCSNSNQIRVLDASTRSPVYRVMYFTGNAINEAQLQQMKKVSGFMLSPIDRRDSVIKHQLFFEIINASELTTDEFHVGLQAINDLSFVGDARFEPVVQPTTIRTSEEY